MKSSSFGVIYDAFDGFEWQMEDARYAYRLFLPSQAGLEKAAH
jgi:hypothetical protein